jgi:hypothetical protein
MDYNGRLKPIHDKGLCGDAEQQTIRSVVKISKYTVVFTGAGISTSCGIAGFRGSPGGLTVGSQ